MPQFLPGAVFSGILTVLFVIVQRARAGKPRLSAWKLGLKCFAICPAASLRDQAREARSSPPHHQGDGRAA